MIKHIVFWRLKESAEGADAEENGQKIIRMLEALGGKIEGMGRIEAGIDFNRSDAAYDLALYSEFESREALDRYQRHPEHEAARDFIVRVTCDRAVVDYEK